MLATVGEKQHSFDLSANTVAFLKQKLIKKVGRVGDPPVKQIVPGPIEADVSKAVRCCVDWAIKKYNALPDGKIRKGGSSAISIELHDYQRDFLETMARSMEEVFTPSAALEALLNKARNDAVVRAEIFDTVHWCDDCGSINL